MVAEVIPRMRGIRLMERLDYLIPRQLSIQPGMTVQIPFRSQLIFGVVIKLKTSSSTPRLRSILSIAPRWTHLSPVQINLLYHLSKRTNAPLSLALKSIQLDWKQPQKTPTEVPVVESTMTKRVESKPVTGLILRTVERIRQQRKPILLTYDDLNELSGVLQSLYSGPGQHLVLVPDEETLRLWSERLDSLHPVLVTSRTRNSQLQTIWRQVQSGQAGIWIGTRRIIFLPPDHFSSITILDEESTSFHQDQHPRYDARELAAFLSQELSIPCLFVSRAPRIASAYRYPVLSLAPAKAARYQLVDLQRYWEFGGAGMLTPELLTWLPQHVPAVIFFNRSGRFRYLICRDCKQLLPLTQTQACLHCGSWNLRLGGAGTERIEQLLKQEFPDLRIQLFDPRHPRLAPDAEVVVTTSFGLNKLNWSQFQGIGIVSLDHQLALPDFQAGEWVFQLLTRLLQSRKPLLLQTISPGHPVIQAALGQRYDLFYRQELTVRKKFGYPPFGLVVKLIDRQANQVVTKKVNTVDDLLPLPDHVILDITE